MKRACVDLTLELLAELLRLPGDIQIVDMERERQYGDVIRLHLRGAGLPAYTECYEGEPAHHVALDEIMRPAPELQVINIQEVGLAPLTVKR